MTSPFKRNFFCLCSALLCWLAIDVTNCFATLFYKQKVGDDVYFASLGWNFREIKRYNLASNSWQPSFSIPENPVALAVDSTNIYLATVAEVWRRNLDGSGAVKVYTATNTIKALLSDSAFLFVVEERPSGTAIISIRKSDQVIASSTIQYVYLNGLSIAGSNRKIYALSSGIDSPILELGYNADGTFGSALYKSATYPYNWSSGKTFTTPSGAKVLRNDRPAAYSTNGLGTDYNLGFSFDDIDFVTDDEGVALKSDWLLTFDSVNKLSGAKNIASCAAVVQRNGVIFCFNNDGVTVDRLSRTTVTSPPIETLAGITALPSLEIFPVGGDKVILVSSYDKAAYLYSLTSRTYLASTKLLSGNFITAYSRNSNKVYIIHKIPGLITQLGSDATAFKELPFASVPFDPESAACAGDTLLVSYHYGLISTFDVNGALLKTNSGQSFTIVSPSAWIAQTRQLLTPSSSTTLLSRPLLTDGTISGYSVISIADHQALYFVSIDTAGTSLLFANGQVVDPGTGATKGLLPYSVKDGDFADGNLHTLRSAGSASEFNVWSGSFALQKSLSIRGDPLRLVRMSSGSYAVFSIFGYGVEVSIVDPTTGNVGSTPVLTSAPSSIYTAEGVSVTFSVTVDPSSGSVTYQWFKDNVAIPSATSSSYTIPSVSRSHVGSYSVKVTNATASVQTAGANLDVGVSSGTPWITDQSHTVNAIEGAAASMFVAAQGTNLTYTWYKYSYGGNSIVGSGSVFNLDAVKPSDAGLYICIVRSDSGSQTTSSLVELVVSKGTPLPASETSSAVTNISTRMFVDTGSNVAVAGFVVTGNASKRILIRASGPSLAQYVGNGAMSDPRLRVFDSSEKLISSNDDWDSANEPDFKTAGAFPWTSKSKDAALVLTLMPGSYTAQVSIQSGAPGTALVEVYDLDVGGAAYLSNISTRALVKTGADIAIAGFVVSGKGAKQVLIRGAGPALKQFGLTDVLTDPKITVLDGNGNIVSENSSWNSDLETTFTKAGAFAWTKGSKDAALAVTLQPGNYTVHLKGEDNGSGVAIVEVYELK